jgi:hypothetical protein
MQRSILERVKKFIRKLRKSPNAQREFGNEQDLAGLPRRVLVKGIDVRWNSTFRMLERFFVNRQSVNSFLLNGSYSNFPTFESSDWKIIESLINVLGPIAATYDLLQKRTTSVSFIYPIYYLIRHGLENSTDASTKALRDKILV